MLFDFHETLAQLRPSTTQRLSAELDVSEQACRRALGDLDARVAELRLEGSWPPEGDVWPLVYALLLECLGVDGDSHALARVMTAHYEAPASYALFPEVAGVLERLAGEGLRLGVLSNTDVDLWAILEHLGVAGMMDAAIALRAQGLEKPEPDAFGAGLDALGVEADRAWFVGDSLHEDAAAAETVGVRAVLVDRTAAHQATALPRGVVRITTLQELPDLILDAMEATP